MLCDEYDDRDCKLEWKIVTRFYAVGVSVQGMTVFVLGTNSANTSAALCDYLETRAGADDVVHAVNSLHGRAETSSEDIRKGEDALNAVADRLDGRTSVEIHQLVQGNDPDEDLFRIANEFDADELVIGVRKRNPTGKVVFGSTAQRILLNSDRPMAVVPLDGV